VSPYPQLAFAELSERCYGGIDYPTIGERAALPPRSADIEPASPPKAAKQNGKGKGLRLLTYRPLFSGPAVDRIPELQFQRPGPEIELSSDDARRLGVASGAAVQVRSNGTSVELRARVNRNLVAGVARVPAEHAQDLGTSVEVTT
jgi:anaerobic selenocysteine-containing dehydrogenase